MTLLEFIFRSVWHFIGFCLLLVIVTNEIACIVRAFRKR